MTSTAQAAYTGTDATQLTTSAPNITNSNTSAAVRSQDCAFTGWDTANLTAGATIMGYLEPLLSCTSWCNDTTNSPLIIYRFSNVGNGKQ